MADENNSVEMYCPLCGNITVLALTEPLLLAPGSIVSPFENMHSKRIFCVASFRIEVGFHQESDD